jgi:hypothetical protein
MRMMMTFKLPVEKGNQAFKDGSLAKAIESLMSKLKPEAAYFGPMGGKRAGIIIFEMADASGLVSSGEPLFHHLDAEVEIVPVMVPEDLRKGFEKTEL